MLKSFSSVYGIILLNAFSLLSFVLEMIAVTGSIRISRPTDTFFISKLDLNNLKLSELVDLKANKTREMELEDFGLPSKVSLALWSYCEEETNGKVSSCNSTDGPNSFNVRKILYDIMKNSSSNYTVGSLEEISLPKGLSGGSRLGHYSTVTGATLIVGIVISLANWICGLVLFCKRDPQTLWFGAISSAVFALCFLVASSCSTAIAIALKTSKGNERYGLVFEVGGRFMVLMWFGFIAALLNCLLWIINIASRNERKLGFVKDNFQAPIGNELHGQSSPDTGKEENYELLPPAYDEISGLVHPQEDSSFGKNIKGTMLSDVKKNLP